VLLSDGLTKQRRHDAAALPIIAPVTHVPPRLPRDRELLHSGQSAASHAVTANVLGPLPEALASLTKKRVSAEDETPESHGP